jgi:hypothetical protein
MPVEISRIQPGIYLNVVSGALQTEVIGSAIEEMASLAAEHNDPYYVVISDATEVKNIPFDIKTLRRFAEKERRIAGFLIVQAPYLAKVAANIITRVSSVTLETYETRDAALQRAQEMLAEKENA